jgi:hypothetical protein
MNAQHIPDVMTAAQTLNNISEFRRARAKMVLAEPENFMICEGCSSILFQTSARCPFCAAYRFDRGTESVCNMARLLGDRPLAAGVAVLPRGTTVQAFSYA